jgi:hypothetical protein
MRWVTLVLAVVGCGLPQPDVVFPVSGDPTPALCKNISSSCAQFLDPAGACFQPKGSCKTQLATNSEGDPERDYCWSNGARYSVMGVGGSDYSTSGSTCLVLEAGNPATLIADGELLEYDAKTRTLHCPDGTTADLSQCDNFDKLINPDVSKCTDGTCD